jgi:plastocyanin
MARPSSRVVLHRVALIALALLVTAAVWRRDPEAGAFAALVLVGIFLLALRRGLFGRILLALVFLDTASWMGPAAVSNVRHTAALPFVALPVALAVASVVGVLAAVGLGRRWIAIVGLGVALAAVAGSRLPGVGTADGGLATDLRVTARNVTFSPTVLKLANTSVAVRVTNHDLFWHTFTIDKLHVDLFVPLGATRRVVFSAKPGRYEFYCRIPGHKQAGMKGTLTISPA